MRRMRRVLAAIVLFAVSCGSSETEDLLTELGLSEQEAACLTREYEARDLDVDKLLRADNSTDLTNEELTGRTDVAALCFAPSIDEDNNAGEDTNAEDTNAGSDGTGDDPDTESSSEADNADTSAKELSPLEQALIDTLEAEGLDPVAGRCLLTELDAAGFSIFDLMTLGLDPGAEPDAEMIAAFLRCGDEFVEAGIMDLGDVFNSGAFSESSGGIDTYGDDPRLDGLWDACGSGDRTACDELYWEAPIGSEYENFARSCGGTLEGSNDGSCAEAYRGSDAAYGDDPRLDALYDSCADGDMAACDELYWEAPVYSEYEMFGNLCGDRSEYFLFGDCEAAFD